MLSCHLSGNGLDFIRMRKVEMDHMYKETSGIFEYCIILINLSLIIIMIARSYTYVEATWKVLRSALEKKHKKLQGMQVDSRMMSIAQ